MLSLMQWEDNTLLLQWQWMSNCQFLILTQHMYYTKHLAVKKTTCNWSWVTHWSSKMIKRKFSSMHNIYIYIHTHIILYRFNNIWKNSFHCYLKGILSFFFFFSLCKKTINKWPLYGVVPQENIDLALKNANNTI